MEFTPVAVAPRLVDMQEGEELSNFVFVDRGKESFDEVVTATRHSNHKDKLRETGVVTDSRFWPRKTERWGVTFRGNQGG